MAWHEFPPFSSSNVATVRYDAEQLLLEVEFHNGGRYHYYDVPQHVVEDFERAESKGSFLAREIKGHYRYGRV